MNQKTSREKIAEAIVVTMFTAESSQLCWENVYGKNLYEILFEEDSSI
jgi:hypothetical protein